MIYLCNAFSLQMVQGDCDIAVRAMSLEDAIAALVGRQWDEDCEELHQFLAIDVKSCIGHVDTANIVGSLLGFDVPVKRTSITLKKGDTLIVAQVTGGRLPEGATSLPEGAELKFIEVKLLPA